MLTIIKPSIALIIILVFSHVYIYAQGPVLTCKVENNEFVTFDNTGQEVSDLNAEYWSNGRKSSFKTNSNEKRSKSNTIPIVLDNGCVIYDFKKLQAHSTSLFHYKHDPFNGFSIILNVYIPNVIEDNTIIWEFNTPSIKKGTEKKVSLGLYINKDRSLYLRQSAHDIVFKRNKLKAGNRSLNYVIPIYTPVKLDVPDNNCRGGHWYRITACFSGYVSKIIVTKPCPTYYDYDGTVKDDPSNFPAQRRNASYNAGYGGNYGTIAVQNVWVESLDWGPVNTFVLGDISTQQKTKIYIDELQFYDYVLQSNFVAKQPW